LSLSEQRLSKKARKKPRRGLFAPAFGEKRGETKPSLPSVLFYFLANPLQSAGLPPFFTSQPAEGSVKMKTAIGSPSGLTMASI
jgi:hypothetical protein